MAIHFYVGTSTDSLKNEHTTIKKLFKKSPRFNEKVLSKLPLLLRGKTKDFLIIKLYLLILLECSEVWLNIIFLTSVARSKISTGNFIKFIALLNFRIFFLYKILVKLPCFLYTYLISWNFNKINFVLFILVICRTPWRI